MELYKLEKEIEKQITLATEGESDKYYWELKDVDVEMNDATFVFHIDFELGLDHSIENLNIYNHYIQFADFEAKMNDEYIKILEKELNQITISW